MKKLNEKICLSLLIVIIAISTMFGMINFANNEQKAHETNICIENLANLDLKNTNLQIEMMNSQYKTEVKLHKTKTLFDFIGNKYELIECEPQGYIIYNEKYDVQLEYSANSPSPYLQYKENNYYAGSMQFYHLENNILIHCLTGEIISLDNADSLFSASNRLIESIKRHALDYSISNMSEKIWKYGREFTCVDDSYYFFTMNTRDEIGYQSHWENYEYHGICGYIAAGILTGYFDHCNNYIDKKYFYSSINGEEKYFRKGFHDWYEKEKECTDINDSRTHSGSKKDTFAHMLYVTYGDGNTSTWSARIDSVMKKYFKDKNIKKLKGYSAVIPGNSAIKRNIDRNEPVIIFGNVHDPDDNGEYYNHAIVAYGYCRNGYHLKLYGFLCHYGWANYSQVTVNVFEDNQIGSIYFQYRCR